MDKTDLKLLTELDKNPRIPLSILAKKLRISQQVADYRLKRLVNQGVITKFATIVNLKTAYHGHHLEQYRIFFTFNAKKEISNKDIFNYLNKKKKVYWAARIGGKYDLVIVLIAKDFRDYDKFINDFNNKFPGLVKDYKSSYVVEHQIFRHKYWTKDYSAIRYGEVYVGKQAIDDLDYYILSKIKDNCRLSALELSKGMNVSYKTIINRIKNLERKGVILGYRLFLKSVKEKPFIVLMSFKDYSTEKERRFISYLTRKDSITQLIRMFGIWNLFLHIRIEDSEKLQNLIIELRDKFGIIDNYEIIPVFEDISIDLLPV